MYDVILFLHVGSAMAYFLFHGAVASVTFALKRKTKAKQRQALSDMLDLVYSGAPLSLLILLVSGVILAFMGRWWSEGWIWTSILAFVVIAVFMFIVGGLYYARRFEGVDERPWAPEVPEESQTFRLAYGSFANRHHAKVPMLLTVTGVLVMGGILWLMMFKPF